MCVISCNSDHFNEDARTTYLTWENGQYAPAPAPSMFYVPGLRPIFQKRARRARRQATARRRAELERTQALPYASYPRFVSQRGSKEGIYSGCNAFTTSRNSREHGISGQLGPAAATGSTVA